METMHLNEVNRVGMSYIGKTAQSSLLTGISANGKKFILPAQKITGYEVIEMFGEPELMLTIGGQSVLESTVFNVK